MPLPPSLYQACACGSILSRNSRLPSGPCVHPLQVHHTVCKARLQHLRQYDPANACVFGDPYNTTRVNRIIIDYMLRRGHHKTAEALAQRYDIRELVDIEIFVSTQSVIQALLQRNCSEALSWCKENQLRLKRLKSTLEIHLRLQEFIELALKGNKLQVGAAPGVPPVAWRA